MLMNMDIRGVVRSWDFDTGEESYAVLIRGPGGEDRAVDVDDMFFAAVVQQYLETQHDPQGAPVPEDAAPPTRLRPAPATEGVVVDEGPGETDEDGFPPLDGG